MSSWMRRVRRSRFGAEQIGVPPPSGAVRMTECSAKARGAVLSLLGTRVLEFCRVCGRSSRGQHLARHILSTCCISVGLEASAPSD
jgi:hypothetical protein